MKAVTPQPAPTLASWIVFPATLIAAIGGAIYSMGAGMDPKLATAVFSAGVTAVVMVLERVIPYTPDWNRSRGDVLPDAGHMTLAMIIVPELTGAALAASLVGASAWLTAWLGMGLWPSTWPLVAQLALALVIGEFGQYWFHRLSHTNAFVWRLHALHHSAPRLYWLNAGRFHPFDTFTSYVLSVPPMIVLGAGEEVLALFLVFTSVHGLYQHANIDVRLGGLNWVFSMAELHRWHHSRDMGESLCNYGANIIVWDIVFGTRYLPRDRRPPTDIGIGDMPDFPTGFIDQLASPFTLDRYRSEPQSTPQSKQ